MLPGLKTPVLALSGAVSTGGPGNEKAEKYIIAVQYLWWKDRSIRDDTYITGSISERT
jgi:hypothetical protein